MREIPYFTDPDDRVGIRCFDQSGDGTTSCMRRNNHPNNTKVLHPSGRINEALNSVEVITIEFNHRGQKDGKWMTW